MQFPFNFDKAFDGLAKVTLKGGVVGKVTFAVVAVSFALLGVAVVASNMWVSIGAGVLIFALSFPMLWRLISFADRNPQAAILEGAEFILHQQIIHSSKNAPVLPDSDVPMQPYISEELVVDPVLAQQPDVELPPKITEEAR